MLLVQYRFRQSYRTLLLGGCNDHENSNHIWPRDIRIEEVDIPVIGPDDVLVQVKASGICGSDVHRYLGTDYGRGYYNYPMNSGHEYCGDVVQTGNRVKEFRERERVTLGVSWVSGKLGAFSEYVHIPNADNGLCRLYPRRSPIPMAH